MKTNLNDPVTRHCWMCLATKPLADFYANPKHLCKQCCAERTRQWARSNPDKRKEISERYRKGVRGKATFYRNHKKWREKNKWCDRERAQRESAKLTDFYIKTLLKHRGVKDPTSEQITAKRRYIQTLRARRALSLVIYGSRTQN